MTIWKQAALACLCAMLAIWWWAQRHGESAAQTLSEGEPTLVVQHASTYRFDAQGALLDTLQAESVQYFHDDRDTFFTKPILRRETAQGHLHGQALNAHLLADGNVHFSGEVLMQRFSGNQEDMAVRSNTVQYDANAQTLSSQEDVEIISPESRTQSTGAIWQIENNYLILQENVRSHYEPNSRR